MTQPIKIAGVASTLIGAGLMVTGTILYVVGGTPDVIRAQANSQITSTAPVYYLSRANRVISGFGAPITAVAGGICFFGGLLLMNLEIEEEDEEEILIVGQDEVATLKAQVQSLTEQITLIQGGDTLIQGGDTSPLPQEQPQSFPFRPSETFPLPPVVAPTPAPYYEQVPGAYLVGGDHADSSPEAAWDTWSDGDDGLDDEIPFFDPSATISDLLESSISNQRHVLVAAPNRTGKTAQIVAGLKRILEKRGGVDLYGTGEQAQFMVIDPKNEFWGGLEFQSSSLAQFVKGSQGKAIPGVLRVDGLSPEIRGRKVLAVLNLVEGLRQKRAEIRRNVQNLLYAGRATEAHDLEMRPIVRFPFILILDEWTTTVAGIPNKAKVEEVKSAILRTAAVDNIFVWQVAHSPLVGDNFPSGEAQDQLLKVVLAKVGKRESLKTALLKWLPNTHHDSMRDSIDRVEKKYPGFPYAFSTQGHNGQTYGVWRAEDLSKYVTTHDGKSRCLIPLFPPPDRLTAPAA